ncbi:MAG TPA: outer membrane beta-barrel protein [Puia sp.]
MNFPLQKYVLSLSLGLLLFSFHSFSQAPGKIRGSVKGSIVDTAGKQILSEASVSATPDADTNAAQFVVTNKKGAFLVRNLNPGKYHLLISFEGYQHLSRTFSIAADSLNNNIDLGTLYMQRSSDEMEAVIVSRPPIMMKKDTVEYSASMFATKPNAVAEDLLKKMPGVQVDKNGNITAQGETVTRILVDGKRFFSDDPKLATRNLPPDVIDKIQVFDDLSDQSKFTGFDDGNRVKTINIVTKKDKRQGYFGKMVAGVGSDQNYDESVNMHRFDNNQQISLLGQANNINKQNFTLQDILGSSGGRRGGGGGGGGSGTSNTGVTTVWAGGANYKNSFGTKTDLYGSYFYNYQHVSVNTQDSTLKTNKDAAGGDSSSTSTGGNSSVQRIQSHRIYLNLEHRFDSSNSLIFRPNVTIQQSMPDASFNTYVADSSNSAFSSSIGHSSSINSGFNINGANLQLRHKFNKPSRTISLDMNTTANVNNGTGYNYAVNSFYTLNHRVDSINQFYNDSLHSVTLSPTLSYTEPIGKNQILEFNYNHTYTKSKTINNTYDFVDSAHDYKSFDSLFSNSYKFVSNSDRFTLNYRIQNAKYNLSLGSGLQYTGFNSDNITKNITVAHNYVNLTPTANFQYHFSTTSHLRLNYSGRTGTPTPSQLQPLTTTSDEINYTVGNPNLKPQFTHSLRLLYASFDPGTQRVIFATINASTIVNDIQSSVYYNQKGGQNSTYVNLNGTYNVSGYFNYGFALKKPKSNLNLITNVNYSQSQTLQARDSAEALQNLFQHLYSKNTTLSQTISWTTNIKKNFDMNFSSTSQYNINKRTGGASTAKSPQGQSSLNSFSQILSAEITAYTNSGWLIATTLDYTYTNTGSSGYNASVPLLTPSIAKQLFKKKNGELRLSVFDLLNSNTSVSKTVTATQAVYTRTNVLTRYAMLTFTYNLNNFAGSQQKRMPGMFPGRFRGGGGDRGGGFGGPLP